MSTALVSQFYDVGDVLFQNRRNNQLKSQQPTTGDRRIVGAQINSVTTARNRNFSTGSTSAFVPVTGRGSSQGSLVPGSNMLISKDSLIQSNREHKKLDRSMSEPTGRSQGQANINSSRYKTEMCRPFEESGHCKYGDKCQFAHGLHELRSLARHPKYKTELCRTFHTIGFCPYGPRCHFIHNEDERKIHQLQINKNQQAIVPTTQLQAPIERPKPIKLPSYGSIDSPPSSLTGSPTSLSPTFSGDIFSTYSAFQSSSSSSSASSGASSDSCRSSPVFNYSPVTDLISESSVMQQLNINVDSTTSNSLDFSNMHQQFNVLNLNFNLNDVFTVPPPSSPESISGDSIGSTTSGSTTSSSSPLDLGKALRLPFFNHLSINDN